MKSCKATYMLKALPAVCLSMFLASVTNAAVIGIDSVTLGGSDELLTATVSGTSYAGGSIADVAQDNGGISPNDSPLGSFDSSAPLTPGSIAPVGRDSANFTGNSVKAYDDSVLTGVAGSVNNASQNGGALALFWGLALTDNDSDPDFFVFEDGGNDSMVVHAILGNGTVGAGLPLSGWNTVSTSGVLGTNGTNTLTGRTVAGVSFNFTDLLDASGTPLTNGTVIQGIIVGDTSAADIYEVYANVETVVPEPSTLWLLGVASGVMAVRRR